MTEPHLEFTMAERDPDPVDALVHDPRGVHPGMEEPVQVLPGHALEGPE